MNTKWLKWGLVTLSIFVSLALTVRTIHFKSFLISFIPTFCLFLLTSYGVFKLITTAFNQSVVKYILIIVLSLLSLLAKVVIDERFGISFPILALPEERPQLVNRITHQCEYPDQIKGSLGYSPPWYSKYLYGEVCGPAGYEPEVAADNEKIIHIASPNQLTLPDYILIAEIGLVAIGVITFLAYNQAKLNK